MGQPGLPNGWLYTRIVLCASLRFCALCRKQNSNCNPDSMQRVTIQQYVRTHAQSTDTPTDTPRSATGLTCKKYLLSRRTLNASLYGSLVSTMNAHTVSIVFATSRAFVSRLFTYRCTNTTEGLLLLLAPVRPCCNPWNRFARSPRCNRVATTWLRSASLSIASHKPTAANNGSKNVDISTGAVRLHERELC
jgi:hypothetical protein